MRDEKGRFKKGTIPWIKGKHLSKETIEKLKKSLKGKKAWNKGIYGEEFLNHFKNGYPKGMLGRKLSIEHRKKISLANTGRIFPKKTRKGMLGKKHSEASKLKMSLSHKGKFNKGQFRKGEYHPLYKKHISEETRNKLRQYNREKASNWQGGISIEPYSMDWTTTLKRSIRERDHYTCKLCNNQQGNIALDVHHIDYDKKNCNPNNLISLCHRCHLKTNYNREYWTNYFGGKIW
jgi:hypothetical protein